ncbi:diguanylate cyclase domain-containing protein [Microbacterium sp. bgisy203]|uniref:diguanylate cyclase domain-containing protein n=1 Tax=Microbacterium sp. bgisy203 TaxID=3413799 RepID=UPI003D72DB07
MIDIQLAQVIVAAVAMVCMIGLGFLYRPSRATALWSLTFVVVMLACGGTLVATASGFPRLILVATGVLLAAPVLIWSGLRALRGATSLSWLALIVAFASSGALVALNGTEAYIWGFRLGFGLTAVFAGLTIVELLRRPERAGSTSMPLAAFSLLVVIAGVVSVAAGLVAPGDPEESLLFLRTINSVGMLAYVVCALVTLLFLARDDSTSPRRSAFQEVAADRLRRAERAGERSWALVHIQLDDASDVRAATGDAGFTAIVGRLGDDIAETFPTEADIGRLGQASFAVLLALPSTVIRERVRTLLRTVAQPHDAVRAVTSASIGWAGVAECGYDLDALLDAARSAAERAAAAGGDRWERAVA